MQDRATIAPTIHAELGATLFISGLRVFVPEGAFVEDIEATIDALHRLAACGIHAMKPDIQDGPDVRRDA